MLEVQSSAGAQSKSYWLYSSSMHAIQQYVHSSTTTNSSPTLFKPLLRPGFFSTETMEWQKHKETPFTTTIKIKKWLCKRVVISCHRFICDMKLIARSKMEEEKKPSERHSHEEGLLAGFPLQHPQWNSTVNGTPITSNKDGLKLPCCQAHIRTITVCHVESCHHPAGYTKAPNPSACAQLLSTWGCKALLNIRWSMRTNGDITVNLELQGVTEYIWWSMRTVGDLAHLCGSTSPEEAWDKSRPHTHTQSISVQCENDGTPQNRTSPATTTTTSAISVKASTVATPPWAVLSEVAPTAIWTRTRFLCEFHTEIKK